MDIYDPANAGRLMPEFLHRMLDEAWARRDRVQPDMPVEAPGQGAAWVRVPLSEAWDENRCPHCAAVIVSGFWTRPGSAPSVYRGDPEPMLTHIREHHPQEWERLVRLHPGLYG